MASKSDINLLRAKTGLSPQVALIAEQLRAIGIYGLALVVGLGLFLGIGNTILRQRALTLESQKKEASTVIAAMAKEESALTLIKKHSTVVSKVMASQSPWANVLEMVVATIPASRILSLSVNDKQEVMIRTTLPSIEETITILSAVMAHVQDKRLRNPVLEGLTLAKDGSVQLTLRFTPTF